MKLETNLCIDKTVQNPQIKKLRKLQGKVFRQCIYEED
jgi:hypothetical protein